MIRIGVLGYGYWGPNLVRNFSELEGSAVVAVADPSSERRALAARRWPGLRTTADPLEVVRAPDVDAVAVATPISTHHPLALAALRAGKHVLVEKPLAASSDEAREVLEQAGRVGRVLLVDHTFVYTGAVGKIGELLAAGVLGDLYYYDSVRVNLGIFQHDRNVLWDLAVHDLSILDHLVADRPVAVSATGVGNLPGQPENLAYLTLFFDRPLLAHIHVNWLSPVKIRRTLIGGGEKMIEYDDIEPSEKVKVYDRGVRVAPDPESKYQLLVSYRSGDVWAPRLEATEALRTLARHFLDCIESGQTPRTGGEAGLRVVRVLEAAEASLKARGRPVELAR